MEKSTVKKANGQGKGNTAVNSGNGKKRIRRSKRGGANRDAKAAPSKPNEQKKAVEKKDEPAARSKKTRTYPTIREWIEVDHAITRGAFDQLFDGFRSAFFHTTSMLGRFGMEKGANEVHEYIISVIDNAKKEIEEETAQIGKQIRKKNGPSVIPRTSPEPERRHADVPAYVVRKYLNLFPAVDRLIDAVTCAENVGAISWMKRAELLKRAPQYLRSPAGRFHSLSTKLSARQKINEGNMAEAKTGMQELLTVLLEQHKELPGIEEKRPLTERPTATQG